MNSSAPGGMLRALFFTIALGMVLVSPLLSNFKAFGAISIGDLVVFFALIYAAFFSGFRLSEYTVFLFFLIAFVFLLAISYGFGVSDLGSQFRIGFYIFSAAVLSVFFKRTESLVEVYIFICICFSFLLFFQLTIYFYSGAVVYYLPSAIEVERNVLTELDINNQGFRSGGIFREPSYLALYLMPALVIAAWRRQPLLWCTLCAASFLSTSVFGVFFSLFSLVYVFGSSRYFFLLCSAGFLLLPPFLFLSVDFLPSRVADTLAGSGSLNERVLTPFREVFIGGNWLFPNVDLVSRVKNGGEWINSLCYVLALFGVLGACVILVLLLTAPLYFFPLLFIILSASHALSTPFFLICYVVLCAFNHHCCSGLPIKQTRCPTESIGETLCRR